jgi:short-subunit dehydrogenase
MDWTGKTCLITGASSGFGLEATKLIAGRGANVIVTARREAKLKELVDELPGGPHTYIACDVSDLDSVRALVQQVGDAYDSLDVLVNNAGIATSGLPTKSTSEEMEKVIRTNLLGTIYCQTEFLPLLDAAERTDRTPVIVNVASMGGRIPLPPSADYIASKFGVVGFTEAGWQDLAKRGIRSMMVLPGLAETEGFPMEEVRRHPLFGWAVMDADRVAEALVRGIERGSFEVRVQWWMHPIYHLTVLLGPLRRYVVSTLRSRAPSDL